MSDRPLSTLPMYSFELVDELDKVFPPRCIGENESMESAQRYAGARALVDKLIALRKKSGEQRKG